MRGFFPIFSPKEIPRPQIIFATKIIFLPPKCFSRPPARPRLPPSPVPTPPPAFNTQNPLNRPMKRPRSASNTHKTLFNPRNIPNVKKHHEFCPKRCLNTFSFSYLSGSLRKKVNLLGSSIYIPSISNRMHPFSKQSDQPAPILLFLDF